MASKPSGVMGSRKGSAVSRGGAGGRSSSPYLQPLAPQRSSPGKQSGAVPGAREAITHVLKMLESLGVGGESHPLVPEQLRRAKFDAPEAVAPLRRALHDLAVLALAGFPMGGAAALEAFWDRQNRDRSSSVEGEGAEGKDSSDLPPAAAAMLHEQLRLWGCPLEALLLGGRAGSGRVSSRVLLLCLGWLVARTGALEAALKRRLAGLWRPRGLGAPDLSLVPPWPEDASGTAEALAAGAASAAAAAAFAAEAAGVPGSGAGWVAVEAKQHAALMLMGRVRAATLSLGALQLSRHRFAARCSALQRRLHGITGRAPPLLSPLELTLATSGPRAAASCRASEAAAAAEEEAASASRHAEVFFAWLTSVQREAEGPGRVPPPGSAALGDEDLLEGLGSLEEGLDEDLEAMALAAMETLGVAVPEALALAQSSCSRRQPQRPGGLPPFAQTDAFEGPAEGSLRRAALDALSLVPGPPDMPPAAAQLPSELRRLAADSLRRGDQLAAAPARPFEIRHRLHSQDDAASSPGSGPKQEAAASLGTLRASNLSAAKRLAALRAAAKKRLRSAAQSLGAETVFHL